MASHGNLKMLLLINANYQQIVRTSLSLSCNARNTYTVNCIISVLGKTGSGERAILRYVKPILFHVLGNFLRAEVTRELLA